MLKINKLNVDYQKNLSLDDKNKITKSQNNRLFLNNKRFDSKPLTLEKKSKKKGYYFW